MSRAMGAVPYGPPALARANDPFVPGFWLLRLESWTHRAPRRGL